jgi:hypothetical protein
MTDTSLNRGKVITRPTAGAHADDKHEALERRAGIVPASIMRQHHHDRSVHYAGYPKGRHQAGRRTAERILDRTHSCISISAGSYQGTSYPAPAPDRRLPAVTGHNLVTGVCQVRTLCAPQWPRARLRKGRARQGGCAGGGNRYEQ